MTPVRTSPLMILTPGGRRPLTDLEKCMLLILKDQDAGLSSNEVLRHARKIKICASCSDRNHVFTTGEKLLKKGFVERTLTKNEYFWRLTPTKGRRLAQQI